MYCGGAEEARLVMFVRSTWAAQGDPYEVEQFIYGDSRPITYI